MDRDSLEMLVRMHQHEILRYVRYLGADMAAAEDVVQDTFLAAYTSRSPAPVEDVRGRAAWLRAIARHKFLQDCRRRRTHAAVVSGEALDRAEQVWTTGFLRDGDGFEYVEALRRCLDALPAERRRAVDMRYAEKRSRADMAKVFGMTEDGVKSLLRRVRAWLAQCVQRRLQTEGRA